MMSTDQPSEFTPDWSVHPGALLRRVLERRGIRQSELAERTGLTAKHINQVVSENIGISGDMAILLERVLDIDTQFWVRADADYQAYTSNLKAKEQVSEYVPWAEGFDLSTLERYGIAQRRDSLAARAEKILKFFGVASPDAFEQTWLLPRVSFRRSQSFTVSEPNTALWLRLVERNAETSEVSQLRLGVLRKVAREVPRMTSLPSITDGFTAAKSALADAGVVLSFVRQVPGTRVGGATWWLSAERPVIGLTERNRKPDIFWFNLLHEIGHVLLHPKRMTFLDLVSDKSASGPTQEQEADKFAEQTLLSDSDRAEIAKAATREQLLRIAARLGVGVPIVAGQHGHITNKWHIGGKLRGTITDEDIDMLERISNSAEDHLQAPRSA
jgi:HTH-type transcriptional regulator / antitoxin HigA